MLRSLLGRSNEDAGSGPTDIQSPTLSNNDQADGHTLGLRIAAVFLILTAGLLGGVPPLFFKSFRNQEGLLKFLIRSFSAGVILALALVHIVPDAIEELVDIGGVNYPIGGTSILFGILIMAFMENVAHLMHSVPHAEDRAQPLLPASAATSGAQSKQLLPTLAVTAAPSLKCTSPCAQRVDVCAWDERSPPHATLDINADDEQLGDGARGSETGQGRPSAEATQPALAASGTALTEQSKQHPEHPPRLPASGVPHPAVTHGTPRDTAAGVLLTSGSSSSCSPHSAATTSSTPPCLSSSGDQHQGPVPGSSCGLYVPDLQITVGAITATTITEGGGEGGGGGDDVPVAVISCEVARRQQAVSLGGCTGPTGHCHDCVCRSSPSYWVAAVEGASSGGGAALRRRIMAYLFELGCVFHSFIIGLSLGVNTTSIPQVRALLLALCFHQALEGLSLTSVVVAGGFATAKAVAMVIIYSITCPAGVAVGIAVATSYDPDSPRARGAQGCLNGVSGGMLLYISLVQLVAEDMGKYITATASGAGGEGAGAGVKEERAGPSHGGGDGVTVRASVPESGARGGCHGGGHGAGGSGAGGRLGYRIRVPSCAALCGGAVAMCLLAVWA